MMSASGAFCPNIKPASTQRGCPGFFFPASLEQAQIPFSLNQITCVIPDGGPFCPNIKPASTDRGCPGFFFPASLEQAQISQKRKSPVSFGDQAFFVTL